MRMQAKIEKRYEEEDEKSGVLTHSNCNFGHVKTSSTKKKKKNSMKNYQYKVSYNLYETEGFSKNYYCRNVQSCVRKINKTINHTINTTILYNPCRFRQ